MNYAIQTMLTCPGVWRVSANQLSFARVEVLPDKTVHQLTPALKRDGELSPDKWHIATRCEFDSEATASLVRPQPVAVQEACQDGILPDGPMCPQCGGPRSFNGKGVGLWTHSTAPAAPTEPNLIALAEKCSAEVGRHNGEVVWVKFHSRSAVEAFAVGIVMFAAVRSHAKQAAPKAEQGDSE